jgi:hypothetical protein
MSQYYIYAILLKNCSYSNAAYELLKNHKIKNQIKIVNSLVMAGNAGNVDFRSVFSAVVGNHLSIAQPEQLFPGFTGSQLPLMKRS